MPTLSGTSSGSTTFADASSRRKNLISLAGLLALLLVVNSVIGLFALYYANTRHQEDITRRGLTNR